MLFVGIDRNIVGAKVRMNEAKKIVRGAANRYETLGGRF